MSRKCDRTGCENDADGVVGIEVYPPKALMDHYKTDKPITRLTIGLAICADCRAKLQPCDILGEGLHTILRSVESITHTVVDHDGCKLVRVPFDDRDYVKMMR